MCTELYKGGVREGRISPELDEYCMCVIMMAYLSFSFGLGFPKQCTRCLCHCGGTTGARATGEALRSQTNQASGYDQVVTSGKPSIMSFRSNLYMQATILLVQGKELLSNRV